MHLIRSFYLCLKNLSTGEQLLCLCVLLALILGAVTAEHLMVQLYLIIAACLLPVFILIRGCIQDLDKLISLYDQILATMKKHEPR
ncbi:hypothetical protein [Neptuniibacter halophilus]|uniref:hypothetical protein n=1 Tax=Neptuniibacter halophilus TaxID=651666 RepID=UPI002573243D|nr:hypothetical protein [Neptuniibacter halophilus]